MPDRRPHAQFDLKMRAETTTPLRQVFAQVAIGTGGPGLTELTDMVAGWLAEIGAGDGAVTIFCRHTSASLTIQENADPDVARDLVTALDRLAPQQAGYRHASEGPDDMPAHIKAMLTGVSKEIPVLDGRMALGTWQGLFLVEHRRAPHQRRLVLRYLGN